MKRMYERGINSKEYYPFTLIIEPRIENKRS